MRSGLTRGLPAAAVIVAAGLGGFFAYGWYAPPGVPAASPAGPGIAPNTPAAPAADRPPGRRTIPDTLPNIAFEDEAGVRRRLSDWRGQPLLVNFWASWCVPCREEVPLLERLSRKGAPGGVQVIGVAVDSRPAVLDYAREEAIRYPLLIGEQPGLELIRALGMQPVFPFSVFIDASGRIVTVKIGILRADQARLILDRIDDLDHGRIDLATARRQISDGIARLAIAHAQATLGPRL
jgi:thiol-disulfide isomerase/thioredoxin